MISEVTVPLMSFSRGNTFGEHKIGLHLNGSGIMGIQTNQGNKWYGPFGLWGGQNENIVFVSVSNNPITVHQQSWVVFIILLIMFLLAHNGFFGILRVPHGQVRLLIHAMVTLLEEVTIIRINSLTLTHSL